MVLQVLFDHPREHAAAFDPRLANHTGPLATWTAVRVPRAMPVEALAALHGVSAERVRAVNGIAPRHRVLAGSTVLVPLAPATASPNLLAAVVERANLSTLPPPAPRGRKGKRRWA